MSAPSDLPLIVAYVDGDRAVRCLSNFATTPFTLDGISYKCVEGFWQSLKTEAPELRIKFSYLEGYDAKQAGAMVKRTNNSNLFSYQERLYVVGSQAHHQLLERAIRAKVAQNPSVQEALRKSYPRPLKHMLRNRWGTWRPGDSPSLPASVFERQLTKIREELMTDTFTADMPLPEGINQWDI